MAVTLTWIGSTPGQQQYSLATLTERYKAQTDDGSQITAANVLIDSGVPQRGDAHPDHATMYCTDRYCYETGESASALDVIYMGVLSGGGTPGTISLIDAGTGYTVGDVVSISFITFLANMLVDTVDGGGEILTFTTLFNNFNLTLPFPFPATGGTGTGATFENTGGSSGGSGGLPPKKATTSGQVASATTNTSSLIYPATATNPATVTFYAISNTLSYYSTDPGDASEPVTPPSITSVITWDLGFGIQPGLSRPDLVTFLLTQAFIQAVIETPPSVEPIVEGRFYFITKTKTRTLQPYAPSS